MILRSGRSSLLLRLSVRKGASFTASIYTPIQVRRLHVEPRARLSTLWLPTGGIAVEENEDAHSKLLRGGFLRQSHSGLFHMLPLGARVQEKIECLIDRHMRSLGASRVSLSTISSEALWEKSGRLSAVASELFRFSDRKDTRYLLSPTHEEEITTLVTQTIKSYKELPLLLYQITRKYRDEFRPRHGLLRSREFTMKDLYSFDLSADAALETYGQVKEAYSRFFADMKLPIKVAKASSGDMGGDMSHEYHLATALGEDHVVSCGQCGYTVNDEIAETRLPEWSGANAPTEDISVWRGISKDRSKLVNVWYRSNMSDPRNGTHQTFTNADVNTHAVKAAFPALDAGVEEPLSFWAAAVSKGPDKAPQLIHILDSRLPPSLADRILNSAGDLPVWPEQLEGRPKEQSVISCTPAGDPLNLLRIKTGDSCPACSSGTLKVEKAIELGHTFYLGTRYTDPFKTTVEVPRSVLSPGKVSTEADSVSKETLHMGCYGIGVSRIIGAVADHLADDKGLQWPRAIAPFEAVIIAGPDLVHDAEAVYDALRQAQSQSWQPAMDVVLDDRGSSLTWKLKDADIVGFPVIVLLGRRWKAARECEIQCRRLGVQEQVPFEDLASYVGGLLERL